MTTKSGIRQLKSGGEATKGWAHNKHILQDQAVDNAIDEASTDLMYKKYLKMKRAEAKVEKYKIGPRPVIKDSTPLEVQQILKAKTEQAINNPSNSNSNCNQNEANHNHNSNQNNNNEDADYDSLDELERELGLDDDAEDLFVIRKMHDQRKLELKQNWKKKQVQLAQGAGCYTQMDERDLLKLASKGTNVVVHFFADTVELGKLVDEHLKRIAVKHTEARFVYLNARMSPFLVNKWKIRTLPSICIVVGGYLVDKLIGFDEFGGKEDFPTAMMAKRLAKSGVIKDPKTGKFIKKNIRTQVLTNL